MSPQRIHDGAAKIPPGAAGPFHEHLIAMEGLARDFKLPAKIIADVYWQELAGLKQGATVDLYLPLRTARRVRKRLGRMPRPHTPPPALLHADEVLR